MSGKRLVLKCDGASRGNPGPSAIGVIAEDESGAVVDQKTEFIGHATNNQAEYRAVLTALEVASNLGAEHIKLRLDSELVVKQIKGQYKVKEPRLKPLFQRTLELLDSFKSFEIIHVPRSENKDADRLAAKSLRQRHYLR